MKYDTIKRKTITYADLLPGDRMTWCGAEWEVTEVGLSKTGRKVLYKRKIVSGKCTWSWIVPGREYGESSMCTTKVDRQIRRPENVIEEEPF